MSDSHVTTIVRAPIEAPVERMHPLVSAAMRGGSIDPATLRDLLAVQREYEAGEARKAYTRALVGMKRDLPAVVERDAVVDFESSKGRTHYTHASLAGVMTAVTKPLTAHGFSLAWIPSNEAGRVRVVCRLTHAEGHHEECALEAPVDKSGNKSDAQSIASTITLLSRYAALSLLGVATADMKEDTGERAPAPGASEVIDAAKNLAGLSWCVRRGFPREEVERVVGRPVNEWTQFDRARLRVWADERIAAQAAPPRNALDELARASVASAAGALDRHIDDLKRHAEEHDPSAGEVAPEDEPPT